MPKLVHITLHGGLTPDELCGEFYRLTKEMKNWENLYYLDFPKTIRQFKVEKAREYAVHHCTEGAAMAVRSQRNAWIVVGKPLSVEKLVDSCISFYHPESCVLEKGNQHFPYEIILKFEGGDERYYVPVHKVDQVAKVIADLLTQKGVAVTDHILPEKKAIVWDRKLIYNRKEKNWVIWNIPKNKPSSGPYTDIKQAREILKCERAMQRILELTRPDD